MTTFSPNPTYYQVTWTQGSPTDYTTLTGDDVGGLDNTTAANYNRLVSITGTANLGGTPLSNGDSIVINGYNIAFTGSDSFSVIVGKINMAIKFTGVMADARVASNYLTLTNACGYEGAAFYIADGTAGTLAKMGLVAGQYQYYPSLIGGSFSAVNGGNITINGVNVVFTAGSANLASVVTTLNGYTSSTSVAARAAGTHLQLSSTLGQPFVINSGNLVSNLGVTVSTFGGYPTTLAKSQEKERANMRWQQVVNELESFSTPHFVGNIVISGNVVGESTPSTFGFVIGYEHPDQVVTTARTTEPDAGTVLVGVNAVKRSVARAMISDITSNRKIFDPTTQAYGSYVDRPNAARIQTITASGIDAVANIVTQVEANIDVVQIISA